MTYKEMVDAITKKEGKKVQVSRANVQEVLSIVSDMIYSEPGTIVTLYSNGVKRAIKNGKKK